MKIRSGSSLSRPTSTDMQATLGRVRLTVALSNFNGFPTANATRTVHSTEEISITSKLVSQRTHIQFKRGRTLE